MRRAAHQPHVELLDELYGADPARLLQIIRMAEVGDPARLMLIGHNPGMHELALMLTGSGDASAKKSLEDNLPTSGLAILDFAVDDWSEVAFRRGELVRFTSPKLLKQASTIELRGHRGPFMLSLQDKGFERMRIRSRKGKHVKTKAGPGPEKSDRTGSGRRRRCSSRFWCRSIWPTPI